MPIRAGGERPAALDQQCCSDRDTLIGHGSVQLGARELDDLAPLLGFVSDELAEIGSRSAKRRHAQIGKPRFRSGLGEGRVSSLLSLSMISAGVFFGAPTPYN